MNLDERSMNEEWMMEDWMNGWIEQKREHLKMMLFTFGSNDCSWLCLTPNKVMLWIGGSLKLSWTAFCQRFMLSTFFTWKETRMKEWKKVYLILRLVNS